MAKIFSFNDKRNGSYIDGVSGDVGVNTNGEFAHTEKGIAWRGNGVDSGFALASNLNPSRLSSTIEVWFSISKTASNPILGASGTDSFNRLTTTSDGIILESSVNSDYWVINTSINYLWQAFNHLYIIADNGTVKSYLNGVLIDTQTPTNDPEWARVGRSLSNIYGGNIGIINIWDDIKTLKDMFKAYSEFLRASPISRSVSNNLDYNALKPTVNNDPRCIAHYNMHPSPGGVLVDISGNGNNGTIVGAVSSKDGMKFNKDTDEISMTNSDSIENFTILTRVNIDSSTPDLANLLSSNTSDLGRFLGLHAGYIGIYNGTSWIEGSENIKVGKDITLAYVYNGGVFSLYTDGVLVANGSSGVYTTFSFNKIASWSGGTGRGLIGDIKDLQIFNYGKSEQQIIDYHNQFAKETHTLDRFDDAGVGQDEVSLSGQMLFDSGEFSIHELAAQDANVPQLDKGAKYLLCDIGGSFKIPYIETTNVDSVIDYYNGSVWERKEDSLADLITSESWLSLSGDYLIFTLTAGSAIATELIRKGIRQ